MQRFNLMLAFLTWLSMHKQWRKAPAAPAEVAQLPDTPACFPKLELKHGPRLVLACYLQSRGQTTLLQDGGCHSANDLRMVVVLAQVTQNQMRRRIVKPLTQKLAQTQVGQVSHPAHHALFD